jgi:DNA-binding beta-propeller fold protein YncE
MAWVADSDNARISVWTRPNASSTAWSNLTTFGSYGTGSSEFKRPTGLALSTDELTVWVVDEDFHRISVWARPDISSTAWTNQTTFGSGGNEPDQFVFPTNVAVSVDGLTAWVADGGNDRLAVWTRPDAGSSTWSFQTTFGHGGSGANARQTPYGIAVSPDTLTVWVTEFDKDRVSVWTRPNAGSTAWERKTMFGSKGSNLNQLFGPRGITVSPDGLTAWVADSINGRIAIWTRPNVSSTSWTNLTTFGSSGEELAQFQSPSSVAISADKKTVWIADPYNARIAIWGLSC